MSEYVKVEVVGSERLTDCLAVRRVVFTEGQNVPASLEVDGRDAECVHVLATVDGLPVGTARLRWVDGGAKVERVAVLDAFRGRGLGRDLMAALEAAGVAAGVPRFALNAQQDVVQFYAELGYRSVGPQFIEANIVHQAMIKDVPGA